MRIVKPLQVGDKAIDIFELTVGELRAWLAELVTHTVNQDLLYRLLWDDMEVGDLCRFSSLKPEEIDDLTPSELDQIRQEVKRINQDFFAMLARLKPASSTP